MSSTLDAGGFVMLLRNDVTDLLQTGDFPFVLAVWFALNSSANLQRSNATEISLAELRSQTGICKPKLIKALDALEQAGFISIGRKAAIRHGRPMNRYTLLRGKYSVLPSIAKPNPAEEPAP